MQGRDNFNSAYYCLRLIIAINTTGITKYKQSVIYKKNYTSRFDTYKILARLYGK